MKKYEGTLLVVDDFELNRDMLSRRLTSRGFSVYAAEGGQKALDIILEKRLGIDLVLLDIMMPDIDGYEILSNIREKYTSADLAVIMVTAKDQSEDIVRALRLGADDYITKPIDFQVALARINNQLLRRKAECDLRESEQRYALAAQGANDGLWDWDLRTGQVYYSDRWKEMVDYDADDIGTHIEDWFDKVHADDLIRLKAEVGRHLRGESPTFSCEYRMYRSDGTWQWLLTRGSAVQDREGRRYRMVGWQSDSTQRVEHDRLTSLPNRGLFLDRLSWALAKGQRQHDDFAIFYMGLDRFKIVNETLGHALGDKVLCLVTQAIENLIRPEDTLARMGGDEFALLSEGLEGIGSATRIADRIKNALSGGFEIEGQEIHVSMSIGIVWGRHREPAELLRMAHSAMETAKNNGKNTYQFYQEGMDASQVTTLRLENRLRKALENEELFLVYQPQIATDSGKIIGVEALLRWQCPRDGLISPATFIPLAEETGLIEPIGAWVIESACRQVRSWIDEGIAPIRMAVNVSSRQFRQAENLLSVVKNALEKSNLEASLLDLELTESLLMENVTRTLDYLNRFHDLGCHLSLDDFGTGYSSLSYLKKFPIDTLKIDQSFVRDITEDSDDAAICRAIISMAHSLRLSVIAEGVETEEHVRFLRDLHCDEMQGYHFSKPLPAEELIALLNRDSVFV